VQQSSAEMVIAPKPAQKMLEVEDPSTWKTISNQSVSTIGTNDPVDSAVSQPQSTRLFPVKPMTVEEKEAADAKSNNETALMGFPGVAMVDSLRFKQEIPKIKKAVEARFSDFPLSIDDADRQISEMTKQIKDFISRDVASVMGTDTNGIDVTIVRTTDHRNADCFKVDVSNYKSPVFMTVLYPNNEQVDDELTKVMEEDQIQAIEPEIIEEQPMQIPDDELEQFFSKACQTFDPSQYETVEEVKNELEAYLVNALNMTYNSDGVSRITIPRAYKEVKAYVEQAVEIKSPKKDEKSTQLQKKVVPPQPQLKMEMGSAGAAL
jgi:hypothetical protein